LAGDGYHRVAVFFTILPSFDGYPLEQLGLVYSGAKLPTVPVQARLRRALDCPWSDLLKGL
jgi:hypothetical protein